jgi:peptidoglycan/xylan/chitin deacetylase (PgdA/CDA1 family)
VRDLTAATGRPPRGWLGPALTETEQTLELLAEAGFTYTLDWVVDDQPFPLPVGGRRFISMPYTVEINDITAFLVYGSTPADFKQAAIDHFDLLRAESARRPGAVFGLALHPFLMNQPSRHRYLVEMLEYIAGHDDVWMATADDIAAWYLDHHYDAAVAALEDARRQR